MFKYLNDFFMPKTTIILLIDDDQILLEMYEQKFKLAKFDVLTAINGNEGFKIATAKKPDCILTDLVMPGSDGFEFLSKLKRDERTKNIPFITLTNLSSESDKKEVMKKGSLDYLVKSNFTPAQVVEKVKSKLKK